MPDRADIIAGFLAAAGWAGARQVPLAGDASSRRYVRLTRGGSTAILMDSPPETGEDIAAFLRAGAHLASCGLSVPTPLAEDPGRGLVLMEDLGDAILARLMQQAPDRASALYAAAVDALVHLHEMAPPDWAARYDPAAMAAAIRPAWQWYARAGAEGTTGPWRGLEATLHDLLARHAPDCTVLLHRDYHAENLVWLPDRDGAARVGMLDFQDALSGHPAYDLASLLQDARRDVDPAIEAAMVAHFTRRTGRDADAFARAYALQAVQRHLRILGVFARLARLRGKPSYLRLLPRTWDYLERALAHPDLAGLAERVFDLLPRPEAVPRPETA